MDTCMAVKVHNKICDEIQLNLLTHFANKARIGKGPLIAWNEESWTPDTWFSVLIADIMAINIMSLCHLVHSLSVVQVVKNKLSATVCWIHLRALGLFCTIWTPVIGHALPLVDNSIANAFLWSFNQSHQVSCNDVWLKVFNLGSVGCLNATLWTIGINWN